MSRGNRMSNKDAARMLATFRPSQLVKMVWPVADMSATSPACQTRGIWRQTDKWAALTDTHNILVTSYEDVGHVCKDAARKLLLSNLGYTLIAGKNIAVRNSR